MNLINDKKIELYANIKNNRIWLPKNIQNFIGKSFIEIKINDISFVTKITRDGRFFIPKDLRQNISEGSTKIRVSILENVVRTEKFDLENKIDILPFIPEKTMSGFDILAIEENRSIRLWYSAQGRPNEITLNQYIPIRFMRLLGYYQAEGGKVKLHKRRGRELNFTNANFDLIADYLDHLRDLLDIRLCKATIRHNPNANPDTLNDAKNRLVSIGLKEENIKIKSAKRIYCYTIKIWITNSILGEIIDKMLNKIRGFLVEKDADKKWIIYFLQGCLAGDGNFHSKRDKHGSLHSYLRMYESNEKVIQDYKKLFEKFGMIGKIKQVKNKQMYIFVFFANWELLLEILKLGLLEKTKNNHIRLKEAIKRHRCYKFGWLKDKELIFKLENIKLPISPVE